MLNTVKHRVGLCRDMPVPVRLFWLFIAIVVVLCGAYLYHDRTHTHTFTIATSKKSSVSYHFGETLARVLQREYPQIKFQVLETKGSVENMRMLHEGKVDFAIVQDDVASVPEARLLATLYPQLFHLVVPVDSTIHDVSDLKGKRVGTSSVGGSSYESFLALIARYEINTGDFSSFQPLSSSDLVKAYAKGELDAVFTSDTIGEERPAKLLSNGHSRLVAIDQAAAMHLASPYIEAAVIPKGAYKANPAIPAEDLGTVAIQTSLLANKDVDKQVVRTITQLIFDHQLELSEVLPPLINMRSPLESGAVKMAVHDGALEYYERNKPNFLQENSDYVALLLTFFTMGISAFLTLRATLKRRKKVNADHYSREIIAALEHAQASTELDELDNQETLLLEMFKRVVDDLHQKRLDEESVEIFMLTWSQAIESVRHKQLLLKQDKLAK